MLILRNELCEENYPLKARTLLLKNGLERTEVYMLRKEDIKKDALNGGYYAYLHSETASTSYEVKPYNLRIRRLCKEITSDTIWVLGEKRFSKRAFARPTPILGVRSIQGLRRTYIVNADKASILHS